MKVVSITHDATGIRMTDGVTSRSWSNQAMLAESFAHLHAEAEDLRAKVTKVREILREHQTEDFEKQVSEIDIAINGEV